MTRLPLVDPHQQPNVVTLGEFRFDRATGELSRNGTTKRLRPQASAVLDLLVERGGDMVSREDFQLAIWPDATVDYDLSLNVCIAQVRDALEDRADSPRYIETLPRRGYRLLVENTPENWSPPASRRFARGLRVALGLAGLALVIGAALSLALFRSSPADSIAADSVAAAVPAASHRMVVLPFRSIPADSDMAYIEEGLAEELITALAEGRLSPPKPEIYW